jgi:hypothetical protein
MRPAVNARVRTLPYLSREVSKPSDTESWGVCTVGALRDLPKVDDA